MHAPSIPVISTSENELQATAFAFFPLFENIIRQFWIHLMRWESKSVPHTANRVVEPGVRCSRCNVVPGSLDRSHGYVNGASKDPSLLAGWLTARAGSVVHEV